MNKLSIIIASLTLLIVAACSTPSLPTSVTPTTQTNALAADQLPTNRLTLPIDTNAPLYYSSDEITQLTNCAAQAQQAELLAPEKRDGTKTYLSKSDYAMDVFKNCTATNHMTSERADRAAFCMSGQFLAEYIWTAKQQGVSEQDVRHRLADSPNKAKSLIIREIYNHDVESIDDARTRLWDDCIHNFKQVNKQ